MKLAVATGTFGFVVVVACGTAGGGAGAGSTANAGDFAQSFCNLIQPCCSAAGLNSTGTLCLAFAQAASAKGTYDPASGQACIAGMQQESGSASFCTSLGNDIPACKTVFTTAGGSVQPGQPCKQDSDCAVASGGGATCFGSVNFVDGGTTQTRTCIQTTAGKAGDGPCVGTVEPQFTIYSWSGQGPPPAQGFLCSNADGLTCSDTTQQCTALADVGQPCTADSECVATAYCAFGGSTSQCTARLADGASCASATTGCQTTSHCDSSTQTCTPYLAPGTSCTTDQQCKYGCVNHACANGTSNIGLALLCG